MGKLTETQRKAITRLNHTVDSAYYKLQRSMYKCRVCENLLPVHLRKRAQQERRRMVCSDACLQEERSHEFDIEGQVEELLHEMEHYVDEMRRPDLK